MLCIAFLVGRSSTLSSKLNFSIQVKLICIRIFLEGLRGDLERGRGGGLAFLIALGLRVGQLINFLLTDSG